MTSVEVILVHGSFTAARCDVDIFEGGVLTVTSQDTGAVVETFPDGVWLTAAAYDEGGYPAYSFESPTQRAKFEAAKKWFAKRNVA